MLLNIFLQMKILFLDTHKSTPLSPFPSLLLLLFLFYRRSRLYIVTTVVSQYISTMTF